MNNHNKLNVHLKTWQIITHSRPGKNTILWVIGDYGFRQHLYMCHHYPIDDSEHPILQKYKIESSHSNAIPEQREINQRIMLYEDKICVYHWN